MTETKNLDQSEKPAQFEIRHLYIKDLSFESPYSPEIFMQKWEPVATIDLQHMHTKLNESDYEVCVFMTITVKIQEKEAYIAEVKQAGIFSVRNFKEENLKHFLNVYCPEMLFPYLREAISNMVVKAGFAPLYIAPVNFEAIFRKNN